MLGGNGRAKAAGHNGMPVPEVIPSFATDTTNLGNS